MEGSLLSTEPFPQEIPPSTIVATISIPDLTELEGFGTESDLGLVHETRKHRVDLIFYDIDESADREAFERSLPKVEDVAHWGQDANVMQSSNSDDTHKRIAQNWRNWSEPQSKRFLQTIVGKENVLIMEPTCSLPQASPAVTLLNRMMEGDSSPVLLQNKAAPSVRSANVFRPPASSTLTVSGILDNTTGASAGGVGSEVVGSECENTVPGESDTRTEAGVSDHGHFSRDRSAFSQMMGLVNPSLRTMTAMGYK